jgi:23S rRNA (uracil1939-C5)-methyltransferase
MELTIEKMIYGGDGLARLAPDSPDGRSKTVFIPFVLPGERVQAALVEERPGFARARPQEILKPSPSRTPAPCPYFASCGGCHYQHTTYDEQLLLKTEILRETLRRTAKIELAVELQVHPSPSFGYRNRTRFHVEAKPEFAIGYFHHGSHELLPVRECPISSPLINRALEVLWKIGNSKTLENVLEIELFVNGNEDDLLLEMYLRPDSTANEDLREFTHKLVSSLPAVRGVVAFTGASSNHRGPSDRAEVLSGLEAMRYTVAGESYQVSAGAFFQTNRHLAERMIEVAIGKRRGKLALDLYSGVGLFALPLARRFDRVIAVESSPISVQDLKANLPANAKVWSKSTEAYLAGTAGKPRPELVVVDPPRAGLGARVCESIAKVRPNELVYVSCDPATLARDVKQLTASGFEIREMHLLDLFPQTFHIETCTVFIG